MFMFVRGCGFRLRINSVWGEERVGVAREELNEPSRIISRFPNKC